MKMFRLLPCIAFGALLSTSSVQAAPYASGVTNNAGTIQYYLNSAPAAMSVTVTTYPSGNHPALTPSTPVQGLNSFPLGSDTSYSISVSQIGSGSPSLATFAASNAANITWGTSPDPRGLDVNCYPSNGPVFGTVYMSCSAAGGTGALTKGRGLFPCNSDMSLAFGATTNGLAGSFFPTGSSTSAPYKVNVSRYDGSVMVSDISAANAGIQIFDPYLVSGTQVLGPIGNSAGIAAGVHGEIYGAPKSTGSLAAGNFVLYTFDYTMPTPPTVQSWFGGLAGAIGYGASYYNASLLYNAANNPIGPVTSPTDFQVVYRYTIGSSLPWSHVPDLGIGYGLNFSNGLPGDVEVGVDGKIFTTSERNGTGSAPWIMVFDPTGQTNLFCSETSSSSDIVHDQIQATGYDAMAEPNGCLLRVSPDGKYLALEGYYCYIAIYALTNGIPDVSTFTFIPNQTNSAGARGIAFDAADNVYSMDSGSGNVRIYDLGLTTTCVTSNDSTSLHGSFSLTIPNVQASVVATTNIAYQANNSYAGNTAATPASFTITLNAPQSVTVPITFSLGGTATNGVNYTSTASGVVNFPPGVTNETVTITPTANPVSGPTLSVILSLKSGASYSAVAPSTATAYIASSGPQVITAGLISYPTMYRGTAGDYVGYQVVRWGDTNVQWTIPSTAFTYSGTAVSGVDYTGSVPSLTVNPGDTFETAEVGNPVSGTYPFPYVGNKSLIVTMSGGISPESVPFTVGPTPSATMTLLDNGVPPETVLWSDECTNAMDTNWNLAFSSEALEGSLIPPANTSFTPVPTFIPNYLSIPGGGTVASNDFDVEFGYVLANDPVIAVPPPNGATSALKVTVNKISGLTWLNYANVSELGADGGVSLYPAGPNGVPMKFTGNYALRFSELTYQDTGGSATEYTQWGINHYGTNANWWSGSFLGGAGNTNIDGIWYSFTCDQGGASFGDDLEFSAVNNSFPNAGWANLGNKSAAGFSAVFKHPPYNSYPNPGGGAFSEGYGNQAYLWNDVELKTFNSVITLTINKSVIFTYTNTTIFTNGDVMLGYCDPFASIGSLGEAYFSNVRVVSLGAPAITSENIVGTNLVITFTTPDQDATPASFAVMSSTNLAVAAFSTTAASTITQSGDIFTAVTPYASTGSKYFTIKQINLVQ